MQHTRTTVRHRWAQLGVRLDAGNIDGNLTLKNNLTNIAPPPSPAPANSGATTPLVPPAGTGPVLAHALASALEVLAAERPRRLQDLAGDELLHIGSFVAGQSLLSLAELPAMAPRVALLVPQSRVIVAAEAVTSLAELQNVLGAAGTASASNAGASEASSPATVRQLPRSQRSEPLVALSRRMPLLPHGYAWAARSEIFVAVRELDPADRSSQASRLLDTVGHREAQRAMVNGGHLPEIAALHGITDPAAVRELEWLACTSHQPESAGVR